MKSLVIGLFLLFFMVEGPIMSLVSETDGSISVVRDKICVDRVVTADGGVLKVRKGKINFEIKDWSIYYPVDSCS